MPVQQSVCIPILPPTEQDELLCQIAAIDYPAVEIWGRDDSFDAIGHFHTAGNPGRNDPDDFQELNYAGICRAIAATPYTGYVGHEFRPKGDIFAALRQAFEICGGADTGPT